MLPIVCAGCGELLDRDSPICRFCGEDNRISETPIDVVEVPARVNRDGIEPLEQAPLAPELLGLVQHVAAYERLTAEAAVTGELETMRKALLAHPLIGQYELTGELLERLLEEAKV